MRIVALVALAGCAKHAESAYYPAEDAEYARGGMAYDAPAAPPPPPRLEAPMEEVMEPSPEPSQGAPAPTTPTTPEQPAADRMVHYEGWARLRVADPEATLDAVMSLAELVGGRTERLSGQVVTVRVPVDTFEESFDRVLELGDVMDKSVRADDVTESFLAVDLRVRTLRATRERLIELLAKATDEREKLTLLQEITRVTTDLDALESQLRTLSDLADLSRISVEAVPREAFSGPRQEPPMDGFEWIASLSPFNRATFGDDKRLELPVPDGLVALSKRGPFAAESPEGSVLWTLRVPNDPIGDADYWVDAVEDRLAEEFASATRSTVGGWSCLEVREPGTDEPYTWWVCAAVDGRHVRVAQAWFPNAAELERYGAAVRASLGGGGA